MRIESCSIYCPGCSCDCHRSRRYLITRSIVRAAFWGTAGIGALYLAYILANIVYIIDNY